MTAQGARKILEAVPAGADRARVRLELGCGCVFEGEIAADRLVETEDGGRIAVGKYRCAAGHPPSRG